MTRDSFYRTFEFYSHGLENHDDSAYRNQRKVFRRMGNCLWWWQEEASEEGRQEENSQEGCEEENSEEGCEEDSEEGSQEASEE